MKHIYGMLVLALAPITTAALAAEIDTRHYIYIEANANVSAKADTATISLNISDKGETTEAAISETVSRSGKVIEALQALGVATTDIETISFRFEPVYIIATDSEGNPVANWPDPDRDKLDGYRATNQLLIKMDDFANAGELLARAAGLGVEINSINFSSSREDDFQQQAEERAAESALEKAKRQAAALGVRLGDLLAAREGTGYSADTMEYPADYGAGEADLGVLEGQPVPIAPPTLKFYASVSAKWEVLPLE